MKVSRYRPDFHSKPKKWFDGEYMRAQSFSFVRSRVDFRHNKNPTLLHGKNVLVYTENRPLQATALDFVQIWAPLVRCMGAVVVDEMPSGN